MDNPTKFILVFILVNSFVGAFPSTDKKFDIDQSKGNDFGHEYENTVLDKELRTNFITVKPASTYEVTEIIDDIPDNRTKGPILTNYTIPVPLNTVLTIDKIDENVNQSEIKKEMGNVTLGSIDRDKEGKKNYVSIFHVKAEFGEKTEHTTEVFDTHQVTHISGIRDYFSCIKKGIVNGFTNIINKHKKDDDVDDSNGPLRFISKLHKTSSDAAYKFHAMLFGHPDHEHY